MVVRMFPIFLTTILYWTIYAQVTSPPDVQNITIEYCTIVMDEMAANYSQIRVYVSNEVYCIHLLCL